ncbi:iron-containing alcohol dehydrogenase [Mycobacterium bohemicum DSM 44277]|uniref:hydroxyacid-oxoacid transhydrogenase n=2 Tax=Mycobacterium bohemicum TaxID=56425 RepID=A0A1X1RAH2_MYCBE|nr:hydroxyacid-oxoacid transhydrogenase [Mycobacterium bohemicum]MCV6968686.1 iron-containing alcohol dehydrogenase [Mycobacterium bohemicum]ORV02128.1 alcohol dehydrogenase [Mycobacterium bohemicum]CPR13040.1 iron-containing alcohol dehydrogenase [Mycobacterium bohemicum DSM 44277]
MSCCDVPIPADGCDGAFTIDSSRVTFGRGCLAEVGDRAAALGLRRVALFTDPRVGALPVFATAYDSLIAAGLDVVTYTDVHVEPTDASFADAARFARECSPDGYVSLGGGSVIDTCKAANLYATHPADLLAYVNAPIGEGRGVPGPLRPHIACPTTAGTGSEVTGIAIFDLLALKAKTGIASHALRPTEALVDPACTATLPPEVVAAAGLDVLSHALESYTARPYGRRRAPERPSLRPMSQGANPWSDMGCREALRILGQSLERAVHDASDSSAREDMMWAATLAGIAFGNAGVHAPHGMAYAVAGLVRDFRPSGYPAGEPLVPHGMAVIVNAPSAFRFTAEVSPARHLEGARLLGADTRGAGATDAGEVLAGQLIRIMRAVGMPNGLSALGYTEDDVAALTEGAHPQQRLLQNAPREMSKPVLAQLFRQALRYW